MPRRPLPGSYDINRRSMDPYRGTWETPVSYPSRRKSPDEVQQDTEREALRNVRAPMVVPLDHDPIDCPCGLPVHDGEDHDREREFG